MGQRIAKTVTNKNTIDGTDKFVTTYYVRDPQGNVLAVYEHKHGDSGNGTFTLTEQHLYGASRLGMKKRDLALNVANASEPTPVTHYELTNHLGNVMAVISDEASTTAEPTVVSLTDYYPYGMTEPGRSWNAGDYRFGYTGHEKENDLAEDVYTTEYRLLDTRLGRWMSVDPLYIKYTGMSSYVYCAGNPIAMMDLDGRVIKDSLSNIRANLVINTAAGKIAELKKEMTSHPESCDMNDMNAQIEQLRKTIQDVTDMRNDGKHTYKFDEINAINKNVTTYGLDGNITVTFGKGDWGVLVHEMRHCGQFARGEMKLADCDDDIHTHDYDIDKEVDAYKAQVAYAGKMVVDKYLENPTNDELKIISEFGSVEMYEKTINHVTDVDVDFVRSIRDVTPNILKRYENKRTYGEW